MPPKKATSTAPARASTRVRKSPDTASNMLTASTKSQVNQHKADGSVNEPNTKKRRVSPSTASAEPVKKTKTALKTKTPTAKAKSNKARAAPTKVNGTTSTASKRSSPDDDEDNVEAPPAKKAKTTATATKPAAKSTAAQKLAKKVALDKKAQLKEPVAAAKPTAAEPATKPATKKSTAPKKAAGPVQKKAGARRKSSPAAADEETAKATKPKPVPKAKAPRVIKPTKPATVLPTINTPPTQRLDVLVFGEGSGGELGLGAKNMNGKKVVDVSRPRLNPLLSAKDVGIVQVAVGGMHCAALTHDNKILTWGVNDQGALGRDTDEGPMKDIAENGDSSSDSDSEDEDSGLNASEAEPREVDLKHFEAGTKFASLYAGDSSTFALTTTGRVYGWGTFRGNDGIVGFRPEGSKGDVQRTPMLIPELKDVVDIATGTNHVLALDNKGKLYIWGTGEQNQLGRRVIERTSRIALRPTEMGFKRKKIVKIGSGDYHSFAIDNKNDVYSWGLNSFGQTGIPKVGKDEDIVGAPTLVKSLKGINLKQIAGGSHHTIACTVDGEVLKWGRVESSEAGFDVSNLPEEEVYKQDGKPRYLKVPKAVPGLQGASVATANDTCIVVTPQGTAYSWGFSEGYQTGLGVGGEVKLATLIDNTAVKGENLVWCGVGGQFGVLGGVPK